MKRLGVSFEEIHSYRDLNLIMTDIQISPAVANTNYIDVPGRNGSYDASEENGEVTYQDKNGKFVFIVDNYKNNLTYEEKKTEISNLLHGKTMQIILDEDPEFYYLGRLAVESTAKRGNIKQIVIAARVAPYKLKHEKTVISADVSGEQTVICPNLRMSTVPEIIADSEFRLEFDDITANVSSGTYIIPDIKFKEGDNEIKVTGNGNITFVYQEGSL